jgi:glycosyltransferase involved in cell wall biosynthesis
MVRAYIPAPRPVDLVYAPIDLAMAICEGLKKKGHEVTYYGPKGSKPPCRLISLGIEPLVQSQHEMQKLVHDTERQMHYIPGLYDQYYVREMFEAAARGEYDVLHFHHPEVALPYARLYPNVPVVYTLHDPIFDWYSHTFKMYKAPNQFFVSISDSQRRPAPWLPYLATVYNGIHIKDYPFSRTHEDYLLFAGRIVPDKGVAEAVQVARKSGNKLLIAGPVFSDTQNYFNKRIKPYLNDDVRYLGYIDRDKLTPLLQRAKAFLMPIKWEEPFGVAMIEAMASGTPVIAMNRGSVPEVVVDGVTGFIVNDVRGMVRAVSKIDTISRQFCHDYVAINFSMQKMVDGYEKVFEAAIRKVSKS